VHRHSRNIPTLAHPFHPPYVPACDNVIGRYTKLHIAVLQVALADWEAEAGGTQNPSTEGLLADKARDICTSCGVLDNPHVMSSIACQVALKTGAADQNSGPASAKKANRAYLQVRGRAALRGQLVHLCACVSACGRHIHIIIVGMSVPGGVKGGFATHTLSLCVCVSVSMEMEGRVWETRHGCSQSRTA